MNQDNLNNVVDNNVDNKVVNNLDSNINDSKENVNIPDVVVEEEEKIYDLSDASVHEEVGVSVDNISSVSNDNFNQVTDTFIPEPTLVLDENQEEIGKVVDKVVEVSNTIEDQMAQATLVIDENSGESHSSVDELCIAGLDRSVKDEVTTENDVVPENYIDELTKIYVGDNYDEIFNKKFNFAAFIFGFIYLLYRKMFLFSMFCFILCTLIVFFTDFWYVYIVINIFFCFLFNILYKYKVKFYLGAFKNKIQNYKYSDLKKKCKNDGGVSFSFSFLGILLFIVLLFGTAFLLAKNGIKSNLVNIFDIIGYDISDLYIEEEKEEESKNKVFSGGLMINTDVNVQNIFSLDIDEVFADKSENSLFSYEYYCSDEYDVKCSFSLFSPDGYVDGDNLIEQVKAYYSESHVSEIEKVSVNNINWNKLNYSTEYGLTYVYVTTLNDKVYVLGYNIPLHADINCSIYNDSILNNISLK